MSCGCSATSGSDPSSAASQCCAGVPPTWVLVGGNLAAMGVGALLIGLSTYVPTWVQGVLGTGAVEAGLALGALTVGWPIAASQCGKLYLRIGFRNTALIGVVLAITGSVFVLVSARAMFLAPDALSQLNMTGPALGVGIPLLICANLVFHFATEGFVLGYLIRACVAITASGRSTRSTAGTANDPPSRMSGPKRCTIETSEYALALTAPRYPPRDTSSNGFLTSGPLASECTTMSTGCSPKSATIRSANPPIVGA